MLESRLGFDGFVVGTPSSRAHLVCAPLLGMQGGEGLAQRGLHLSRGLPLPHPLPFQVQTGLGVWVTGVEGEAGRPDCPASAHARASQQPVGLVGQGRQRNGVCCMQASAAHALEGLLLLTTDHPAHTPARPAPPTPPPTPLRAPLTAWPSTSCVCTSATSLGRGASSGRSPPSRWGAGSVVGRCRQSVRLRAACRALPTCGCSLAAAGQACLQRGLAQTLLSRF